MSRCYPPSRWEPPEPPALKPLSPVLGDQGAQTAPVLPLQSRPGHISGGCDSPADLHPVPSAQPVLLSPCCMKAAGLLCRAGTLFRPPSSLPVITLGDERSHPVAPLPIGTRGFRLAALISLACLVPVVPKLFLMANFIFLFCSSPSTLVLSFLTDGNNQSPVLF